MFYIFLFFLNTAFSGSLIEQSRVQFEQGNREAAYKLLVTAIQQNSFQSEKKLLKEVDLFDVYDGDKLPEGKKSYALSFILQDENKTLNDKQIDKIMQKLQQTFEKIHNAVLR